MTEEAERSREVALHLMRPALPLHYRAGETLAATSLRHSIDTAVRTSPMLVGEELDSEDRSTRDLTRRHSTG